MEHTLTGWLRHVPVNCHQANVSLRSSTSFTSCRNLLTAPSVAIGSIRQPALRMLIRASTFILFATKSQGNQHSLIVLPESGVIQFHSFCSAPRSIHVIPKPLAICEMNV